jgi:hypothetical protein
VAPWSHLPADELLNGQAVLFGVTVAAVVTALLLPFLQRFGIWGLMGLLVAGQLLGVVFMLIFSIAGRTGPVQVAMRSFLRAVVAYHSNLGRAAYAAAGIAAVCALLALSYAVACVAFERRDL